MASPKKKARTRTRKRARAAAPIYSAVAARWYLDTGKVRARERGYYRPESDSGIRADYLATQRAVRVAKLKSNVKNLRKYFYGFDAREGYSLDALARWPAARVKKVEQYAEYLNHLQSQEFQRYVPRSRTQEEIARAFTGQTLPNQKAFIVHVESPRDRVSITRDGEIVIERELKDKATVIYDVFYLFIFYLGWRPATWDQVVQATEDLLPYLPDDPDSRFFLYSELHGEIGVGQPKKSLLAVVRRYAFEYQIKDFASTIIGFKRAGTRAEASMIYQRKRRHSEERADQRKKAWDKLRRKSIKRFIH